LAVAKVMEGNVVFEGQKWKNALKKVDYQKFRAKYDASRQAASERERELDAIITWNACGASKETLEGIIESISSETSWSFILLQEVSNFKELVGAVGPRVFYAGSSDRRTSVVVVHYNIKRYVARWDVQSAFPVVNVALKGASLQACSAHLPSASRRFAIILTPCAQS